MKPNCYECKHRGTIPGDAHSCCRHPKIGKPFEFGITANEHGIRMGWFLWPVNFDPVWLLTCKMFEEKENK